MKDKKIVNYLLDMNISPRNKGFVYLYEAIEMTIKNNCILPAITKIIYPTIAKKYNDTWGCVERCMRTSVRTSLNSEIKYKKMGDFIIIAALKITMN